MFAFEGILVLAALSVIQIMLKKQHYPVWTKKAVILFSGSITATAVISMTNFQFSIFNFQLFLPLLQQLILFFIWSLFLPIDTMMKRRVMKKAKALRSTFKNLTVIGITGSVGKTTTKELIAHVLSDKKVLATPAYVNSEMGVSQWLLRELPKHATDEELTLIIEMGAYRTGEIRRLCEITKPDMGVLTFIGTQHIALFGSQEALRDAKAELIEALPEDGTAFINADSTIAASVANRCKGGVVTVGVKGHIEETETGIIFEAGNTQYEATLRGTHNTTNVLLAVAVAQALEIEQSQIAKKLKTFAPPSSTFSVKKVGGVTILDDTHNASPESFRAAIDWARTQPMEQKILLTPGLIELGSKQVSIHRDLGAYASGNFDRVIFTAKQGARAFEEGYNNPVELLIASTPKIPEGSLLICVGRVRPTTIKALCP